MAFAVMASYELALIMDELVYGEPHEEAWEKVGNIAGYTRANMQALERDGRVVLPGGRRENQSRTRIYHAANLLHVKVRTHLDAERNVVGEVKR